MIKEKERFYMATIEDLKNRNILYAEDDAITNEYLSNILGRYVGKVTSVYNGEEALRSYKEEKPDIIVTDIEMPVMNGRELIENIRAIDKEVPVVIVTAFDDEARRIVDMDNIKVLTKPINKHALLETLSNSI